jgi:hypothetical protein
LRLAGTKGPEMGHRVKSRSSTILKPCTWPYRTSASGLVAEVVRASRGCVLVGIVRNRLIGTGVEDVGGFRISGSNEAAVVCTSLGVAAAAFLSCFFGSTGASIRREKTGGTLVTTAHLGTGFHQLAVSGETYASVRWITWEG